MPSDTARIFDSFDEALGPGEGRFFGSRYRSVTHRLSDVRAVGALGTRVEALGQVELGGGWSVKTTVPAETPHLSTMDMLRFSATLAEIDLACRVGLRSHELAAAWVSQFSLTAGSAPVLDLARIVMSATVVSVDEEAGTAVSTRYEARFGLAKASITVRHPSGNGRRKASDIGDVGSVLSDDAHRLYGGAHGESSHDVRRIRYDRDLSRLDFDVTVLAPQGLAGLESAHFPSASLIDVLAIGGQAAQIVTYMLDDVDRDRSSPFWLRRISFSAPFAQRPTRSTGTLHTKRSALVTRGRHVWRTAEFALELADVSVDASVAHLL
ncbi:AvrD family protein [uncultured Microbacterium sp.]|uniref:AvrD family protein n=1 Tax=uncultured Microbacterium sp. TaxID=191216 RepID=UPI0025FE14E4|nr:AvrD family protein [uncultured Microbacterium sp.]